MNKVIASTVAAVVIIVGGFFVFTEYIKPMLDNRTVTAVVSMPVVNEELQFSFTYPSGEEGYALIQPPVSTSTSDISVAYLLMPTSEYIAFTESDDTENVPPPTISVFVGEAPANDTITGGRIARLQQWAIDHPQYSAFANQQTEVEVVEIDGAQAITYTAGSVYEQRAYIVFYSGNIYAFVGQYREVGDSYDQVFTEVINSVRFN